MRSTFKNTDTNFTIGVEFDDGVFQFSNFFILYFIFHENIFHLKFKRQRMEEKLRWFYFCFWGFRSFIDEIYIQSHFKIDGNKLVNEQRDRKTGDLQVTASREIVDGKMVEVILSFFLIRKKNNNKILKIMFSIEDTCLWQNKSHPNFQKIRVNQSSDE
jgi:hypothetical protein